MGMRSGILADWAQLVWEEDDSEEEVDGSNKQIGRVDVESILKSHCIHEDIDSTQNYTYNIFFVLSKKVLSGDGGTGVGVRPATVRSRGE